MNPGAARGQLTLFALTGLPLLAVLLCSCTGPAASRPDPRAACIPQCARRSSCNTLDHQLVAARQPLLECVGQAAARGHLAEAHRCYRALRLLESARWWLQTLTERSQIETVYQPAEAIRQEFLCRIEQLAQARIPQAIERIYLEMIRSYP